MSHFSKPLPFPLDLVLPRRIPTFFISTIGSGYLQCIVVAWDRSPVLFVDPAGPSLLNYQTVYDDDDDGEIAVGESRFIFVVLLLMTLPAAPAVEEQLSHDSHGFLWIPVGLSQGLIQQNLTNSTE